MLNKIKALVNACQPDEVLINLLRNQFKAFSDYVQAVVHMEYEMPIIAALKEGEEYREAVQELDKRRKIHHDCAISACNMLNRLSAKLGLEPFYEGSTEDRHQVADFAGKFVDELYFNGIHRGQDLYTVLINGEARMGQPPSLDEIMERQ